MYKHIFNAMTARECHHALRRANWECAVRSGLPDYEYQRRIRVGLLKRMAAFRRLTGRERMILDLEKTLENSG